MRTLATPQSNFLAVTGLLADPKGGIVQPPQGPLDLSWLFRVSAESKRQAREKLAGGAVRLDEETLGSWFVVASPADTAAIGQLQDGAWRRALRMWTGADSGSDTAREQPSPFALHNAATLHRLLYLSEEAEDRPGHLRASMRLYADLSLKQPNHKVYRGAVAWFEGELEKALEKAYRAGEDEEVAQSLNVLAEAVGMAVCENVQEELMLGELDDLALLAATLVRELLPYQGVVHAPAHHVLTGAERRTEEDFLPLAIRLRYRMVEDSRQRRRVEAMVAELCGLLSGSFYKSQQGRSGQKWQREAQRWEPHVASEWNEPPSTAESPGDELPARVTFPEVEKTHESVIPRSLGLPFFGVRAKPTHVRLHEAREEWLEAFRVLGLPLFPLRRYAVYRNTDTEEIGDTQRLPLLVRHYLWQAIVVMLGSLGLAILFFRNSPGSIPTFLGGAPPTPALSDRAASEELEGALERLKKLAVVEADLLEKKGKGPSSKANAKRLKAIEDEREALFDKIQELERAR